MELTNQYKSGLLKLAALLGLLCFFIMLSFWWPRSEPSFVLNEKAQCFVENQELILEEAKLNKKFKYYANSINNYRGYQLGLSIEEIDRLLMFRETGRKIYTLKEFKNIAKIDSLKLEAIKTKLVFPKRSKVLKNKPNTYSDRGKNKLTIGKRDINKVTSAHLHDQCNLSWKISNRIVNFRNSIKKYASMKELDKVYGISKSDLSCINSHYKIFK